MIVVKNSTFRVRRFRPMSLAMPPMSLGAKGVKPYTHTLPVSGDLVMISPFSVSHAVGAYEKTGLFGALANSMTALLNLPK